MHPSRYKKFKTDKLVLSRSLEDPLNLKNSFPESNIKKSIVDPVIIPSILNVKDPLNLQHDIDKEEKIKISNEICELKAIKKSLNIIDKPKTRKNSFFVYGNYPSYYKYRNKFNDKDLRLDIIKIDWLHNKIILDVGCNSGLIANYIAKHLSPYKVTGIDIDRYLIKKAHSDILTDLDHDKFYKKKPKVYHKLSKNYLYPMYNNKSKLKYPYNIEYFATNFVVENEKLLKYMIPEYDVILFLSISKWIHINWGDSGLILSFKRIYKQLNERGLFIFEPQDWSSYKKAKKKINKIYTHLQLKPQNFKSYLLNVIGFSYVKAFYPPSASSVGFERTIYVYLKAEDNLNLQKYVTELHLEGGEYKTPIITNLSK